MHRLSLSEYQALVADLPMPSEVQIESFIGHVCDDHSWHKHLPLAYPGAWFTFFLNPLSGMRILEEEYGNFTVDTVQPRKGVVPWASTSGRHRAFGFLDYRTASGPGELSGPLALYGHSTRSIPIISTKYRLPVTIPLQVLEVGSCELTAVIHQRTAWPYIGKAWRQLKEQGGWSWPAETGGPSIIDAIIRVCDTEGVNASWIRTVPKKRYAFQTWKERLNWDYVVHPELKALLSPERDRQYASMRSAIDAMLGLVVPISKLENDGTPSETEF